MTPKPQIADAPGLIWRPTKTGWEARWQARTDLIGKGFSPKSQRLWVGLEPTEAEAANIRDNCRRLQDEMLIFARGGMPERLATVFDGTMRSLINCYQTDPDSSYHKKQYAVRKNHDTLLRRITERHGHEQLADIKARVMLMWDKEWTDEGRMLATGASVRGQWRVLFSFGATILEDPECERLCAVMSKMRFPHPKPRVAHLSSKQATAHREMSRKVGYFSIALADAMQFDLTLRQRDVIGELVPISEPGVSDVHFEGKKWIKGVRWEELNERFILSHVTSKRGKLLEVDLHYAPMVMDELSIMAGVPPAELRRDMFPASGPIIVSETTGRPWKAQSFRQRWRKLANLCGIPKDIRSMDARAGAITEAADAGALLEDIRHAATHSDVAMTQRYSRDAAGKVAKVMKLRLEHRKNKSGDND